MDPEIKCTVICMLILMTLTIFLFGMMPSEAESNIDTLAHLGGFISGLFLAMIIAKPEPEIVVGSYEKNVKIVGSILLAFFVGLSLMIFYFLKF